MKPPCNEKKPDGPRRSPSPGEMKARDKKTKMHRKSVTVFLENELMLVDYQDTIASGECDPVVPANDSRKASSPSSRSSRYTATTPATVLGIEGYQAQAQI